MEQPTGFKLFTSLRYDPILLSSKANQELCFSPNCPLYMPVYHRDRILEAARYFKFKKAQPLLEDGVAFQRRIMTEIGMYERLQAEKGLPLRVKVVVSREGDLTAEITPVAKVELAAFCPQTLDLPPEGAGEAVKPFEPSPLTGGAITMGPTDYMPVENHTFLKAVYTILLDSEKTEQNAHTNLKTTHRPHYDASRERHVKSMAEEVLLQNPRGEVTEGSITTPYFYRSGRWVTPPVHEEHGGQRGTTRRWALATGICVGEEVVRAESVEDGERVWVSNGVRGFGWGIVARRQ